MNKTELMTEIMKLTGHSRSIQPEVHFGILRLIDKYVESEKSARIRELEGALEYAIDRSDNYGEVLYPDVYQKIEQALNKKEQSNGE